ncbi:unnamed protein product [Phytophthora fragariaefolia]|uniref:Unnamed protein product n=1 Tax=Phytophthora fragariaefolia TaxID=1490495 RepID=A0A9W6WPR8_9STRA|nr:unnamed protein product [Phytophthora fragariaefolia]
MGRATALFDLAERQTPRGITSMWTHRAVCGASNATSYCNPPDGTMLNKHHLVKRNSATSSTTLITDTFRPQLKSNTTKPFQDKLAWWVYNTGMTFYKVGHASLTAALQLLHPGDIVPTSDLLTTILLDQAYTKSIKVLGLALAGKVVTLVTDGWTDINGQAVVNYVVVCSKFTFFLK